MVHDEIEDDLDVAPVCPINEPAQVGVVAEFRIDHMVACRIITLIPARRLEEGGEPYRIHPEMFQVIHLAYDAFQVAISVSIRIIEATDVNLIRDGTPPPFACW